MDKVFLGTVLGCVVVVLYLKVLGNSPTATEAPSCKPEKGQPLASVNTKSELRRGLVFTLDNRLPRANGEDYVSRMAVINYLYAKKHGYDFTFYVPFLNWASVTKEHPSTKDVDRLKSGQPKNIPCCWHSGLRQLRSAPWAKILATWDALHFIINTHKSSEETTLLYIDSDAYVKNHSLSLEEFVETRAPPKVIWGSLPKQTHSLFFLNNEPWHKMRPCSGIFVMRAGLTLRRFIKAWWDYDLPSSNFKDWYEQDALWDLQDLNDSSQSFAVVDESGFMPYPSNWIRHIPHGNPNPSFRNDNPLRFLQNQLGVNGSSFAALTEEILTKHVKYLSTFEIDAAIRDNVQGSSFV